MKHRPRRLNAAPDCASRYLAGTPSKDSREHAQAPLTQTQQELIQMTLETGTVYPARMIDSGVKAAFMSMYENDPKLKAMTWERIVAAAATDKKCLALADLVQNGFPRSRNDLPPIARVFWSMREEIYCLEGVIIKDNKILIPRQLRAEVLESLHSAHQGVNGMLANARQRLFWPGLGTCVRQTRAQCRTCNTIALSQPREPLMSPADTEFPFQQTVVDFVDINGKNYLGYADRYTGWVEVALMPSGKAKTVCDTLRTWFYTYGAPEELYADGGPPFESQGYDSFLKNWGVRKRTSSAYYPQSNGRAELAVKTAKHILASNTDNCGRLCHDRAARA